MLASRPAGVGSVIHLRPLFGVRRSKMADILPSWWLLVPSCWCRGAGKEIVEAEAFGDGNISLASRESLEVLSSSLSCLEK